jgi:PAS domain S-box-containing protein
LFLLDCLGLIFLTLVAFRLRAPPDVASLLYLFAIALISLQGRLIVALLSGIVSLLLLDYFLTPPVFELDPLDPIDITAVFTFSITALVVTTLVSRMRTSQQQLRYSLENKIRRLVDANIMGIFIWNLEGEIIEANEAFLHMVEYSREDLISGHVRWTDLTPAEWRESDERAVAELKATGTHQPFEKEFFRKDGSRVPVLIGGAMFEGSKNEGVAFVLDLTKQKLAEEGLQKAQAELAHVTRVTTLGQLTAMIAHEINQPLGAIVNYGSACLRLLKSGHANLTEIASALSAIVEDADRASAIIARIRALSKKAPPEMAVLQVRDLVTDILPLVRHELTGRRIALTTALPGDLSPILGDRIQLQQVLLNLMLNGIEAMNEVPEDRRQLIIGARSHISGDKSFVLVTVTDSGIGLKAEDLPRLFETFYTTKAHGLGMGLAISRSIIEAHGGRLWATKNAPQGAVFQFALPIRDGRIS